jgi:2,4-dienoyl-CoA reductase-like NADH-dependent reductase (Old Yellow Enzyme family)
MTIKDFATCAALAQDSGYDGVEVCVAFDAFGGIAPSV